MTNTETIRLAIRHALRHGSRRMTGAEVVASVRAFFDAEKPSPGTVRRHLREMERAGKVESVTERQTRTLDRFKYGRSTKKGHGFTVPHQFKLYSLTDLAY